MQKNCALVLGGFINGFSIIRELKEKGVKNIVLFDLYESLGSKSNKICDFKIIDKTPDSLRNALFRLRERYEYIIIFPTDDLQMENLYSIYDDVKPFCFVPFNYKNLNRVLDKFVQYSFCEQYGIPYPKTVNLQEAHDLDNIEILEFPVLIKPKKRYDLICNVFRNLFLKTSDDLLKNKNKITDYMDRGITFIASEVIPGGDTQIYGYFGYRDQNGSILNEFTGKKLNQFPDDFGVFSSASNEAPEIITEQGQKLLQVMDLKGICHPEFKYDPRDEQYKLMEINLRSVMWNRVGTLTGVNISYSQYLDATGQKVEKQNQDKNKIIHLIYMRYELFNLFNKPGYFSHFMRNVFGGDKHHFAVFDVLDIHPFIHDLPHLFRVFLGR